MTMQASDFFCLDGKFYTLIDVEDKKQIIDYIPFPEPRPEFISTCSACWRGYTAEYAVEDGFLFITRLSAYDVDYLQGHHEERMCNRL